MWNILSRAQMRLQHKTIAQKTACAGPYCLAGIYLVAECSYDVLHGIPWHKDEKLLADYVNHRV